MEVMSEVTQPTTLIYLTGKPGVGKYTIAKELAANHGFIVCDNQLINNPIFELLQLSTDTKIPKFAWDAIDGIRQSVLMFLEKEMTKNYVLTNNLYDHVDDYRWYQDVANTASKRGSLFIPVRFVIGQDEHLKRIQSCHRRDRWKSTDVKHVYDDTPLLPINHPNFFQLNVTTLKPDDASKAIMEYVKRLQR
jgi:tRNA uridine 5-carbamoylmethylation protein Kti12